MFGVLECLDPSGDTIWLYGFSGQFNGQWQIPGWVPPLFDIEEFTRIHDPVEREIKKTGKSITAATAGSAHQKDLIKQRRQLSRELMNDIHDLYRLHNCLGEKRTLHQAFNHQRGKPTGTGDCCAPKLLNYAALSNLLPLSLAEFYFGKTNRSNSKHHGCFYSPCADKCQPLLGFLLCGIEKRRQNFAN